MSENIGKWLEELGLGQFASVFAEQQIDHEVLPDLTDEDLEKLGLPLGPRKKLLKAIGELERELATPLPETIPRTATPVTSHAERRQLTVMFCDLVGSTELSQQLDPEDLRDVNRAYQDACKEAIERYEGYVARYMGDGVLAYFGYPQAHEDDAERAIRAGLGLVHRMSDLNAGVGREKGIDISVRVGVTTGPVVVGDIIGEGASQESAVVGETPNLAARLQTLAASNTVVIGPGTHDLAGGRFEYEDLGTQELKGIAEPVEAWRVIAPTAGESRFEALHKGGLTPLVGREHEIGLLLDRWEQAKEGDGQVVLLSGEPGIGKSHLTQALREHTAPEDPIRLRYQCSPYHLNSAFYPVIEQLEWAARFDEKDSPVVKLNKLESLLAESTRSVETVAPLFSALLSIPDEGRYAPLDMPPDRQKEETLKALVEQLEGLSRKRPVLLLFEDVHWADPTSLALLELIVEHAQSARVMILITFRPDFTPPWSGYTHITSLTLNRFSRSLVAAMVEKISAGKPLPDEVRDQIVEKTDGVPLFVEELTKTVLESGALKEEPHRYVLAGPLAAVAIPTTLHDSLIARLDRLSDVKEVALCASAIGRQFEYDLLAAVLPLGERELAVSLDRLVDAGLVFKRGVSARAIFSFKHVLVQEAAYESLLKRTREQLHARIAEALEAGSPDAVDTQPEVLAHHYTEAGLVEEAAHYWHRAGERAAQRSANAEAIAHLTRGLKLIERLPETLERDKLELRLQISLGPALIADKGFGCPELNGVYLRARELCRTVGEFDELFKVTWGMWLVHQFRAQLGEARRLSEDVLTLAKREANSAFDLQAHHAAWTTLLCRGEFVSCREHSEQGIALYRPEEHRSHAFVFGGHDPGVCARSHAAISSCFLGYADQAVGLSRDAVTLAEQLAHPYSLMLSNTFKSFLHQYRREAELVRKHAEAAMAICVEHQMAPQYLATHAILRGWAMAACGKFEEGLAEIRQSIDAFRMTGTKHRESYYLALLGQACGWTGAYAEGLEALEEALRFVDRIGERTWEAEIHRLKGELLLARSQGDQSEAESCFSKSIDVARGQGAKLLELRATTKRAELWLDQGRRSEAYDAQVRLYDWFTESFDTTDLIEAKALIEEMS